MNKKKKTEIEKIKKELIAVEESRKNGEKDYTVAELDEALCKILDL